jgi:hypothetical protein
LTLAPHYILCSAGVEYDSSAALGFSKFTSKADTFASGLFVPLTSNQLLKPFHNCDQAVLVADRLTLVQPAMKPGPVPGDLDDSRSRPASETINTFARTGMVLVVDTALATVARARARLSRRTMALRAGASDDSTDFFFTISSSF